MIIIDETDNRFYVDASTIPNAGYGCFAKEPLKKGDWLEVIGVMVKKKSVADTCTAYAKRYKFAGSKEDTKIVPMGYAGMVNSSDDVNQRNCELTVIKGLSKRSQHSSEVVYQFTRDITTGEELIGYYGDNISSEVKQMAENLEFKAEHKTEWEEFLSHNVYDLPRLCGTL